MGRFIHRSVVVQLVVLLATVTFFTGVLTIIGSAPTSDVPERPLNPGNVSVTPLPQKGLPANVSDNVTADGGQQNNVSQVPG